MLPLFLTSCKVHVQDQVLLYVMETWQLVRKIILNKHVEYEHIKKTHFQVNLIFEAICQP